MTRSLRLAVALGDPEAETALQAALEEAGHAVARCLAAPDLLASLRAERADAALVGAALYQLDEQRWAEILTTRVPLVLRAATPDDAGFAGAAVVNASAGVEELRRALLAAAEGGTIAPRPARPTPAGENAAPGGGAPGRLFAIGGAGGSGGTTLAANLGFALSLVAGTALVDANLLCPCLGPALAADVSRNLVALAHADPRTPAAWDRALEREGQPLHPRSPRGLLLCGLPKPEQRGALGVEFFRRLLDELRRRHAYVLLDVGADMLSPDAAVHRAALLAADEVLLVARADPFGLWGARTALGVWERQLGLPVGRVALVLAAHDRRRHHAPQDVAEKLGLPLAAVLPEDRTALERAQQAGEPALLSGRGRYAAAVLELADRLHGGRVTLPEATATDHPRVRLPWRRLGLRRGANEHGPDAVPVS